MSFIKIHFTDCLSIYLGWFIIWYKWYINKKALCLTAEGFLVEHTGFEPVTPTLPV